jgi:4'-phosphopantetheinyl transferase
VNRVSEVIPLKGVHLWAWALERISFDLAAEARLLSAGELDRMGRFRFEADRVRFALSHANLRRILSAYLGCSPGDLFFSTNPYGKPYLRDKSATQLTFNLSHTSNIGILAVTSGAEIGVDIETIRPIERDVAEAHFSSRELADLNSLTGALWFEGFYNCWTRKEAILKAEGLGLNLPLAAFDVSLLPGAPPQLLGALPSAQLTQDWKLIHLEPAPASVGALAISSNPSEVSCFTFEC